MKILAYAKINIALNVKARKEDGYHELEMVMVPLELHDEIELELSSQDEYSWNLDEAIDENNTMVKAVHLMKEVFHLDQCFKITCHKNIPMQAGLAGGSADAAAIMRGICQLCHLDISLEQLSLLGKRIGADVPFCVMNQCAVVKGIGEKIEPFYYESDFDILLVKPKKGVPTGKCFQLLDLSQCDHPDIEQVKKALLQNDLKTLSQVAQNSLEFSAFQLVKEIFKIKEDLIKEGFEFVLMSGSGSCVFACTKNKERMNEFKKINHEKLAFICESKILNNKKENFM